MSEKHTHSTDHSYPYPMDSHTNCLLTLSMSIDVPFEDLNAVALESYEAYFNKTIIQEGNWSHWTTTRPTFKVAFHTDIRDIVHILSAVLSSDSTYCRHNVTERLLSQQVPLTVGVADVAEEDRASWLDRLVDIALTLLLCLPVGPGFPLERRRLTNTPMSTVAAQWREQTTFQDFVASQFPEPNQGDFDNEWTSTTSLLKAAVLERNHQLRVRWTHDFREHLSIDGLRRTLSIFVLRFYITKLSERKPPILPKKLIDEYNVTMDILFPSSDSQTRKFLAKSRPDLVASGPLASPSPVPATLNLEDFFYYRERLAALNNYVLAMQPSTLSQLWRQRGQVDGLGRLLSRDGRGPYSTAMDLLPRRFSGSTLALSMRYREWNEEDADGYSMEHSQGVLDDPQQPLADLDQRDLAQPLPDNRDLLSTLVE